MKFILLSIWTIWQIDITNDCYLKSISQNDLENNQHVVRAFMHIQAKYKVSKTIWAGEQVKDKYQNGCHLQTTSQDD